MNDTNSWFPFKTPFPLSTWVVIILLLFTIYEIYPHHQLGPGTLAPDDPKIVLLDTNNIPFTIHTGNYTVTPVAQFQMRARVLHTHTYWFDHESDLSPVDFAMGWGQMSNQDLIDQIDINQGSRWYTFHYDHPLPVNNEYIYYHSGNMHMIPATPEIKKVLEAVSADEIIDVQGYLVSIDAGSYHWASSVSLPDEGDHSCKVVWVQSIVIEK
jgi:hypothetical protein